MQTERVQTDSSEKPFIEHLEDFRRMLIRSGLGLGLALGIAIPLAPYTLAFLKVPYQRAGLQTALQISQVGGGLAILMNTVFWSGLLISFPFLLATVAWFVFPGLSRNEKRAIARGGVFSLILFVMGVAMAWRWTVPVALRLMGRIEDWMGTPAAFWDTAGYVAFVLKLLLAFGAAFQLPLLVLILGHLGIVNSHQLREKRRHVAIGLLVISMIMTPPDPFTMILMATPLIILYEICIWLIRVRERQARWLR